MSTKPFRISDYNLHRLVYGTITDSDEYERLPGGIDVHVSIEGSPEDDLTRVRAYYFVGPDPVPVLLNEIRIDPWFWDDAHLRRELRTFVDSVRAQLALLA